MQEAIVQAALPAPLQVHDEEAGASLDNKSNDAKEAEKLEQKLKRTNIFTYIAFIGILATFGFQGVAIGLHTDTAIIIISGVIGCVVAGTAAVKQIIMKNMDTLRVVHNKIRGEVNRFMEENNKLTRNVDGLEDQVMRLQDVEKQLNAVASRQGATAEELTTLVKENSATLKQQKVSIGNRGYENYCLKNNECLSYNCGTVLFILINWYKIDACKSRFTRATPRNCIAN